MKTNFYLEFAGQQLVEKDLITSAKSIWTENGNKASDLKSINLYVKPEENMAYYVFNDDETGSFAL